MLEVGRPSDFRAGESFRLDADNREGNAFSAIDAPMTSPRPAKRPCQ